MICKTRKEIQLWIVKLLGSQYVYYVGRQTEVQQQIIQEHHLQTLHACQEVAQTLPIRNIAQGGKLFRML